MNRLNDDWEREHEKQRKEQLAHTSIPQNQNKSNKVPRNAYFRPPKECEKFRDNWDTLVECTNQVYGIKN